MPRNKLTNQLFHSKSALRFLFLIDTVVKLTNVSHHICSAYVASYQFSNISHTTCFSEKPCNK